MRVAKHLQFPAAEVEVLLTPQDVTDSYPVEASGWDIAHSFFVEKAELKWDEVTGKHLTLSRSLCPGTMTFLRLLQPISQDRSLSVSYQAQHAATTAHGKQELRLTRLQPNSFSTD